VRPEDILVLAHSWNRVWGLAGAIRSAGIPSVLEVHVAKDDQDRILRRRGCLPLSTVASAKGYDAYCTLLASANDFPTDVSGRASFYVGCTRAIEYLEVFAHRRSGLVAEMERALGPVAGPSLIEAGPAPTELAEAPRSDRPRCPEPGHDPGVSEGESAPSPT
jgi:hypothetical protein